MQETGISENLRQVICQYEKLSKQEQLGLVRWIRGKKKYGDFGPINEITVVWNYFVDKCMELWKADIEYGRDHKSTLLRQMVIYNIHNNWVSHATYDNIQRVTGLHKSTTCRQSENIKAVLRKPRIGLWTKIHEKNDALQALYNELIINEE